MVGTKFFLTLDENVFVVSPYLILVCLLAVELIDFLRVHGVQIVPLSALSLGPAEEAREVTKVLGLKDLAGINIPSEVVLTGDGEGHLDLRLRACLLPAGTFAHDSQSDEGFLRTFF